MSNFHKAWESHREKKSSNIGSREKQEYTIDIDKETRDKIIKPAGITNIWEQIQAQKDQADINIIIQKAQRGDYSGFIDDSKAVYGDMTKVPDNLVDMMRLKNKAEQMWAKLPIEVREAYDHDPDKYLMDYGSEKWLKLHGINTEKEEVKEEAKTE